MCLIIAKQIGGSVDWQAVDSSATFNNDGAGVCYPTKAGTLARFRSLEYADVKTKCQKLEKQGLPFILHLRYATHGKVSKTNAHPFRLKSHGLMMAHNGIISTLTIPKNMVDSRALARELDAIMPRGFLTDDGRLTAVEDLAQTSRLTFMDASGHLFFVNEDLGKWKNGVWYSQPSAIAPRPTADALGSWWNPDEWDEPKPVAHVMDNYHARRASKTQMATPRKNAQTFKPWKPTQTHPDAPRKGGKTKPVKKGGKK